MRRREFIALVGGAAVSRPLAARATKRHFAATQQTVAFGGKADIELSAGPARMLAPAFCLSLNGYGGCANLFRPVLPRGDFYPKPTRPAGPAPVGLFHFGWLSRITALRRAAPGCAHRGRNIHSGAIPNVPHQEHIRSAPNVGATAHYTSWRTRTRRRPKLSSMGSIEPPDPMSFHCGPKRAT